MSPFQGFATATRHPRALPWALLFSPLWGFIKNQLAIFSRSCLLSAHSVCMAERFLNGRAPRTSSTSWDMTLNPTVLIFKCRQPEGWSLFKNCPKRGDLETLSHTLSIPQHSQQSDLTKCMTKWLDATVSRTALVRRGCAPLNSLKAGLHTLFVVQPLGCRKAVLPSP